jgi:hypothetical protein
MGLGRKYHSFGYQVKAIWLNVICMTS